MKKEDRIIRLIDKFIKKGGCTELNPEVCSSCAEVKRKLIRILKD